MEREWFVVEVTEKNPEEFCHRNVEYYRPTEDADEEHERSDEEVEDCPVSESSKCSRSERDRFLSVDGTSRRGSTGSSSLVSRAVDHGLVTRDPPRLVVDWIRCSSIARRFRLTGN